MHAESTDILFKLYDVMSELGVGLESGVGLDNLRTTEMNYHLSHKVHLMKVASLCNWAFRSK